MRNLPDYIQNPCLWVMRLHQGFQPEGRTWQKNQRRASANCWKRSPAIVNVHRKGMWGSLRGEGGVAQPFGFALTDPSVQLSRTRLLLKFDRLSKRSPGVGE